MNRLIPLFIIPCTFLLYMLDIHENIYTNYLYMVSKTEKEVCTEETENENSITQKTNTEAATGTTQEIYTEASTGTTREIYTEASTGTTQEIYTEAATGTTQEPHIESSVEAPSDSVYISCPIDLIEQVNGYRAANGLQILSHSSDLDAAAAVRCRELIASMSHTRPDGRSCSTVYTDLGIPASVWGENLAAGYDSSVNVAADWMASSAHMANILDESFTRCGVAYISCDTGYGSYWVILFSD